MGRCPENNFSGSQTTIVIAFEEDGRNGQLRMGKRIIGIKRDRLFKLANRAFDGGLRTLDHQIPTPQVCIMGLGIRCCKHAGRHINLQSQTFLQCLNNGDRDFILHFEDVVKRPVIRI